MWNRVALNFGAGTAAIIPAQSTKAMRIVRSLMACTAAGSVDIQTTGGVSLSGGPITLAAGIPVTLGYVTLDDARNNPLFNSGIGLGVQLVILGGTVTGFIDYSIAAG